MARASKRAKMTTVPVGDSNTSSRASSTQAKAPLPIPFQTGPSLERVPEDVLQEILSYLPTLTEAHALFGSRMHPPAIPSASLVRTPTLRALSQTSRLLRSRSLAMAWQSVELCGVSIPKHSVTFYKAIGEATRAAVQVLRACPHLRPLIQTVSVVLTRFQSAEIVPAFADCLTTLPNLTTVQVIHAHTQMATAVKNGFEGKRLTSVRRITVPCSAHEIVKSCPNVEDVTSLEGNGSTIVGSIIKGDCRRVRVLRNVGAPLTRLVKMLTGLTHVRVTMGDMTPLSKFPFLDTIEIDVCDGSLALGEREASCVKQASEILKKNRSEVEKTVVVIKWDNVWGFNPQDFDATEARITREVIRL